MAFDNVVIPDQIIPDYLPEPSLRVPDTGILDLLSPGYIGGPLQAENVDPIKQKLEARE